MWALEMVSTGGDRTPASAETMNRIRTEAHERGLLVMCTGNRVSLFRRSS